jgi:AcrR family transcriptional regulator
MLVFYEQKLTLSRLNMSENSIRNIPRQSRSQQTLDLILDTAAASFVDVGYENTTTNAIAEKAGISIGTLYRYFPDKDAVLQALAERYNQQSHLLFETLFVEDAKYLPPEVLLDRLIDPFLDMYRKYPVYAHILLGADVSADIAAASCGMEAEMIAGMADFFRMLSPGLDKKRSHLIAVISKAVVKMLISLVTTSTDEQYQADIIAEVKQMMLCYLGPILELDEK